MSTFHSKDVAVVSCKLAYFSQMIGYDFLQIYGWAQDGKNSFFYGIEVILYVMDNGYVFFVKKVFSRAEEEKRKKKKG